MGKKKGEKRGKTPHRSSPEKRTRKRKGGKPKKDRLLTLSYSNAKIGGKRRGDTKGRFSSIEKRKEEGVEL